MARNKYGGNKAKGRQAAKHKANGKYTKAFWRCIARTGKWRGKKYNPAIHN